MTEEWRPIIGYEELYEVSNLGRVKTHCYGRWGKTKMRKLVPDKNGYMTLCLKKNGKYTNKKVHRLVAEAFIPNPNDYPMINHKDLNKANNEVSNLEWCTCKYNNSYANKFECCYKPVNKLDEDGNIIKSYSSEKEAGYDSGIDPNLISPVVHGKRKHAGGYKWEFQY